MSNKWIVRGRKISPEDVKAIRELTKEHFHRGRNYISRQLAHHWEWYQANGQLKDMACRYILLFLEKQGIVKLPPRLTSANNDKKKPEKCQLEEIPLKGTVKNYPSLKVALLGKPEEYKFWNRVVHSYHYQGHKLIVGKYLKYIAYINNNPVACLGWGSAAWSIKARDEWIGWQKQVKDANLCMIVNNIRFLILPWVKIKYLASHLLGLSVRIVPKDWQKRYGHLIYLLET